MQQKRTRLGWLAVLGLPLLVSACGHSTPATATLSVSCGGTLTLAGATSIDASGSSGSGTVLNFPDPANAGRTGTIAVAPGQPCTITPVLNKGS